MLLQSDKEASVQTINMESPRGDSMSAIVEELRELAKHAISTPNQLLMLKAADELEAQAKVIEQATKYARGLAVTCAEKHWKDNAPNWRPLDDLVGILTQLDNMLSGMDRASTVDAQAEKIAELERDKARLIALLKKGLWAYQVDGFLMTSAQAEIDTAMKAKP